MTNTVRDKVLTAAKAKMLRFGYRKVTMDEIAADLRMSKNTIYLQFQSKVEIAQSLFDRLKKEINAHLDANAKAISDPLDLIHKNIYFLQKELSPWFEHFLTDIKQELPGLWKDFVDYRTEKILEIETLIKAGIRSGQFRKVNATIAAQAFLGAVDAIINPEFLQNESISFQQALDEVLDLWSEGMLPRKR